MAGAVACLAVGAGITLGLGFPFGHDPPLFVDRTSLGGHCDDRRSADAVSESKPWCSLRRAVAAAPAGRTVHVRASYYESFEVLNLRRSAMVTLKAYRGETPVLAGRFKIRRSSNFRVEGFKVRSPRLPSSVIQSSHIEIADNDFSPQGLHIRAAKSSLIEGNHIHDVPRLNPKPVFPEGGTDGNGITANGHWDGGPQDKIVDLTIRDNVIRNIPRDGITLGGGSRLVKNVVIEGNEFGNVRRLNNVDHSDSIQLQGGDEVTVRSNFFHDSEDAMFIGGDSTRSLAIENNLMIGGTGGGIQVQMYMTPNARIVNNTIWNSGYRGLRFGVRPGMSHRGLVLKNNVIDSLVTAKPAWFAEADYNLIAAGPLQGSHSIRTHPVFANPEVTRAGPRKNPVAGDYRLAPDSPGIDAGTSSGVLARDWRGAARFDDPRTPNKGGGEKPYYDMGAYELR